MDYNTGHTARFLVSLFLTSKHSLKYKLTAIDRSILRYLADCIDNEFHISGKRGIKISLLQIGTYSGCSRDGAKLSIRSLIRKRLLGSYKKNGSKPIYWVGNVPIAYQQRKSKLSTTEVNSEKKRGNGSLASNSFSKLQTYNKDFSKNESEKPEKLTPKKSVKENKKVPKHDGAIDALKAMAEKLGKSAEMNHN